MTGSEFTGQARCTDEVGACRGADAQPLVPQRVEDRLNGFRAGDLVGEINTKALQIAGDAALADALGDRRSATE